MNIIETMHSGALYRYAEANLLEEQRQCMERLFDFNATRSSERERRAALLQEMFAEVGEGCYIEPPLHANWAGRFVHLGRYVYANFNLTLVDDAPIYIGDYTQLAPNVTLTAAGHPIDPTLRQKGYQFNVSIHIGRNCWLGAGAIVLPGVSIGDNSVIGAGSVVTRDIPANVVALGNPCRVLRPIDERDRVTYFRGKKIPPELAEMETS